MKRFPSNIENRFFFKKEYRILNYFIQALTNKMLQYHFIHKGSSINDVTTILLRNLIGSILWIVSIGRRWSYVVMTSFWTTPNVTYERKYVKAVQGFFFPLSIKIILTGLHNPDFALLMKCLRPKCSHPLEKIEKKKTNTKICKYEKSTKTLLKI